jgi:exopolysaccharide biosynthesis protein
MIRLNKKLRIINNKHIKTIAIVMIAIVFCFFIINLCHFGKLSGQNSVQNKPKVPISYQKVQANIAGKQSINLLIVDFNDKRVKIKPILAENEVFGFEYPSEMLQRQGAYAGVNGSFFGEYGQPAGMVVIDGQVITSPQSYPVLGMTKDNKIFLDRVVMNNYFKINNMKVGFNNINKMPRKNDIVLLTDQFGGRTRLNQKTLQIFIKDKKIQNVVLTKNSMDILKEMQVILATGSKIQEFSRLKPGQDIEIVLSNAENINIENAIECGPWLIKDGKKVVLKSDEWIGPLDVKDPRTAAGITKDNHLILLTVDGRQPEKSVGITGDQLANYMLKLGVVNAAFLDGGGSTTMWVKGKTVNVPSYKGIERKVGNAIGVFY